MDVRFIATLIIRVFIGWLSGDGAFVCSAKDLPNEAHRICKPEAFMVFKWNDHDTKLESMLKLMSPYWKPLFGQTTSVRTMRASTTYWVMLDKGKP